MGLIFALLGLLFVGAIFVVGFYVVPAVIGGYFVLWSLPFIYFGFPKGWAYLFGILSGLGFILAIEYVKENFFGDE